MIRIYMNFNCISLLMNSSKRDSEFARQMMSPNLKKINRTFEVTYDLIENKNHESKLKVEFIDGSVWETPSKYYLYLLKTDRMNQYFISSSSSSFSSLYRSKTIQMPRIAHNTLRASDGCRRQIRKDRRRWKR